MANRLARTESLENFVLEVSHMETTSCVVMCATAATAAVQSDNDIRQVLQLDQRQLHAGIRFHCFS